MQQGRRGAGVGAVVVVLATGAAWTTQSSDVVSRHEIIVPLEEISAFEAGSNFLGGETAACGFEPNTEGRTYPTFVSERPLYGEAELPAGATGFALDESGGTGKGYDVLYLDLDRDGDLTSEPPRRAMTNAPPRGLRQSSSMVQRVRFQEFPLGCDYGDDARRTVVVMPLLRIDDYDGDVYRNLSFFETTVRRGAFAANGVEYRVLLGLERAVGARLDGRRTTLKLAPARGSLNQDWWDGDELGAMHELGDTLYSFSVTPTGDQLTVHPYPGPFGVLEVAAGGRDVSRLGIKGSVRTMEWSALVGEKGRDHWGEFAPKKRLPVGDYLPVYVTVEFGELVIGISNNYHGDGKPRGHAAGERVYGIAIREDQPYAFDFSHPPEVMFASPARDLRIAPGEKLEVMAVLTDPVLDFMIRDLETRPAPRENRAGGGIEKLVSLDPIVLITRADGEKVVTGVMPFG